MSEKDLSVVNHVRQSDLESLQLALAGWGYHVVALRGDEVTDRLSLFAAAQRDLPGLDECAPGNWSSFEDCMTSLVFELELPKIALIWTGAHRMLEGGLADLLVATDILTGVARVAYSREITFLLFMLGEGPNFPAWSAA